MKSTLFTEAAENEFSICHDVASGKALVHLLTNILFQVPSWAQSEEKGSSSRAANLSALFNLLFFLNPGPAVNKYYFSYYNEYYFSYAFSTSKTGFFNFKRDVAKLISLLLGIK